VHSKDSSSGGFASFFEHLSPEHHSSVGASDSSAVSKDGSSTHSSGSLHSSSYPIIDSSTVGNHSGVNSLLSEVDSSAVSNGS
jgi:hypothetical protein